MQSENLALEWNDVAVLTDQRACTVLGKTMLRLPADDIVQIEDVTLLEWKPEIKSEYRNQFAGIARVLINCRDGQELPRMYQAELPVTGLSREPVSDAGDARLLYRRGMLHEDYLLLETVLQVRQDLQLQPTQVIVGQFDMEELLEIPSDWPACEEILTTASEIEIQACSIHQQMMQVTGVYHLAIVYADEAQQGECLFVYGQNRPFQWQIAVPSGLQEVDGVQPCYQSLSVKHLDSRQIQLTGNGVVCTLPDCIEKAQTKAELPDSLKDTAEVDTLPQAQPHTPSVVNSRGSRRANLSKYMRDLNGMGQSPTSVKNFEIGETVPEPEAEQNETEA